MCVVLYDKYMYIYIHIYKYEESDNNFTVLLAIILRNPLDTYYHLRNGHIIRYPTAHLLEI